MNRSGRFTGYYKEKMREKRNDLTRKKRYSRASLYPCRSYMTWVKPGFKARAGDATAPGAMPKCRRVL